MGFRRRLAWLMTARGAREVELTVLFNGCGSPQGSPGFKLQGKLNRLDKDRTLIPPHDHGFMIILRVSASILAIALLLSGCAGSKQSGEAPEVTESAPAIPFVLPIPEGWRTETIPFPLEFAPELDYEGLEELRFAPGMFEAEAEDYWTYTFVWWLLGEQTIDSHTLDTGLLAYFEGLVSAVAEAKEIDLSEFGTNVELTEIGDSDPRFFEGKVETVDAFVTLKAVTLNVRVEVLDCSPADVTALFFALSPQPVEHVAWSDLARIRGGFQCAKSD